VEDARGLLDAGRLDEAVLALNDAVRSRPADIHNRVLLFELLCFQGSLDRAAKQLDVISSQSDAGTELAIDVYRGLLAAEAARRSVFHGEGLPKFVAPPGEHIEQYALLLKAIDPWGDDTGTRLEDAEDRTPTVGGQRQGKPFSSFRDADDRVAGVIEVFHGADYLWVPIDQVTRLEITPPRKLRELMWAQAKLQVGEQRIGDVFVPALYVDSYLHSNGEVKLGRVTEWEALHDAMVVGAGRRTFLIDGEEVGLFELGDVIFAPPSAPEDLANGRG
jgi:type VI secretion system protein ImpE